MAVVKAEVKIVGKRPLLWHRFGPDTLPLEKKARGKGDHIVNNKNQDLVLVLGLRPCQGSSLASLLLLTSYVGKHGCNKRVTDVGPRYYRFLQFPQLLRILFSV